MMSPASIAQFIRPGGAEFDLVVIDEASQMRPEEALGTIGRGRQLVVVGDPHQLPPTSFFERIDIPGEDEDEDYVDTESILDLALAVFHPARELRWHYRSRHESLIAFSNKHFYEGKLVVFPSPTPDHADYGIEHHMVEGLYTLRASVNLPEAQAVAEAALQFMATHPDRSLGIATINQAQREILSEEMDRIFARDRHAEAYRARWEKTLEPFFVKNLENVQGDERDVIFISTVYGPEQRGGRVAQRFGPINSAAGHRRLNVLFTRAKEKVVLFSSMQPSDVLPTESSRPGVTILKEYLDYASSGQLDAGVPTSRNPDSDFEVFVANRLRREGFEVVPQGGVAGYFIDLAVRDPRAPQRYLLGVECDGATYHSARSARDRDRLRQEILERKGWKLYRIWSTDWFSNSDREVVKLTRYIHELIGS
jgi:very-short-patch-repair endonuclease